MILYSSLDLDIHICLSMIYKGVLSYISETLSKSFIQAVSSFQDTNAASKEYCLALHSIYQFEHPQNSTNIFEVSRQITDHREKASKSTNRTEKMKSLSNNSDM